MPENRLWLPEGSRPLRTYSIAEIRAAAGTGGILEGVVERCDVSHALHLDLGGVRGRIPREEAVAPWISGAGREISTLSLVGRPVCAAVLSVEADAKGTVTAVLSRRAVQERAMAWMEAELVPGAVLTCRVLRMERFGAFLDIGCGVVALLPLDRICVSRIAHPRERFREGQRILAAVLSIDRERHRITMTHRELLGTWMEEASRFAPGETVRGIVRGVEPYGCFIELTPNLSGLSEPRDDLSPGDAVSALIKSVRPERTKIKLQPICRLPPPEGPDPLRYQITDGVLDRWTWSPPGCTRPVVETVFRPEAPDPGERAGD